MIKNPLEHVEYKVVGTLWNDLHKFLNKIEKGRTFGKQSEPIEVRLAKEHISISLLQYEAKELLARMGTGWKEDVEKAKKIHGTETKLIKIRPWWRREK